MKTLELWNCVQNKFIVINVVVIIIFLINTIFFHAYRVGNDKTEVENLPDMEMNLNAGAGRSSARRLYDNKRSARNHRVQKYGQDFAKTNSSDKWIVVSLNHFNKSWPIFNQSYLSFLDTIHGWTSIIVGEASNSNHGCKSCTVLPSHAYRRSTPTVLKAFITAIKSGARTIYVMTSLHDVHSALKRMTSPAMRGVIYKGKVPFKPCTHFVQPLLALGRSFPSCHDSNWVYLYSTGEFPDRNVIGLCEECGRKFPGNEFVDSANAENTPLYCDASTPNVAVNPESFVEGVFDNSLWHYNSFWALFFYGIEYRLWSSAREKLKMSHVVQRLLWEIFVSMSFVSSHDLGFERYDSVNANETKHYYSFERDYYNIESKLCRQRDLSFDIHIFGQFLYQWKCHDNLTIDRCVTNLSDTLYKSSLIDEGQYKTIYRFVKMLNGTAYEYPERLHSPIVSVGSYIGSKSKSLRFWPSAKRRKWNQNPFHEFCARFDYRKADIGEIKTSSNLSSLESTSTASSTQSSSTSSSTPPLPFMDETNDDTTTKGNNHAPEGLEGLRSNIVLVIVFQSNDPYKHTQMVNFYDYMYGRHFRHIIYCTSGEDGIEMFAKMYPQPMTAIDLKVSDTNLHPYLCMSEVMRMHHSNVDGYLHLNSETLLNPWTLDNLQSHLGKTWINGGTLKTRLSEREVEASNVRVGQMWKDKGYGRSALNNSMQDLLFISTIIEKHLGRTNSTSNPEIVEYLTKYNEIVRSFIDSFKMSRSNISQFEIRYGESFVFYIPAKHKDKFIVLADEFSRYNVHSYLVIPTIIKYLDSKFLELNGTILPIHHTNSVLSAYRLQDVYLHPWEMHLLSSEKRTKFMCNTFLRQVNLSLTR